MLKHAALSWLALTAVLLVLFVLVVALQSSARQVRRRLKRVAPRGADAARVPVSS